ncbi:low molecular weight phosphatase family protein [Saccharopolyspora sp. HNM0983]|uniref:Low molecular weight phosphatase family protein n=1 Tax=Saccharopolyspora montiporae TaxID=2781240 RepID=A0A929G1P1_9PSEU|nr:low molecular weight phosphatase family protein [Saccharopolyspora sp. HNM0983]MBE9376494.1 low molecular weight phosphatase family protein [Saccharopolyspora sp. HNM0983]
MTAEFTVLFVCTGNVRRSAFAELAAAQRFAADPRSCGRIRTTSAGTRAVPGLPIDPRIAAELDRRRVPGAAAFASARLGTASIAAADLVLTAHRGHRSAVVELVPTAVARTFCLLEFARLAALCAPGVPDVDPVSRIAELTRAAARARGTAGYITDADDRIADPAPETGGASSRSRVIGGALCRIAASLRVPGANDRTSRDAPGFASMIFQRAPGANRC